MSIRTLLDKNTYKIYVDNITLKGLNLSSDGNYKIVLPPIIPIGTATLSVLAVDIVDNDIITLKWLEPSESLPFDTINCRVINVDEEINCLSGLATIGTISGNVINAVIITAPTIDTKNCIITSDDNLKNNTLKTSNSNNGNLTYYLPTNYPSTSGQVLSSTTSGNMSWSNISYNLPSDTALINFNSLTLNSTSPSYIDSFDFTHYPNTYYKVFWSFSCIKENSGGTFQLEYDLRINNAYTFGSPKNPNTVDNILRFGNDIPDNVIYNRSFETIVRAQEKPTNVLVVSLSLISNISSGGILRIIDPICVITPFQRY